MADPYLIVTSPLDEDKKKFFLQSISGEESISGLFRYDLQLVSGDDAVDFSQIVGKAMTVSIKSQDGKKQRYIHGKVTRFVQQGGSATGTTGYHAELRPWLWELGLTEDHKIFQSQTALDIVKAVFDDLGYSDYEDKTSTVPPTRDFCVQYGESALNFVSRLMEDEGIFYYFKHESSKHTMILADATSGLEDCPNLSEAKIRPTGADWDAEGLLDFVHLEEETVPGKVTLRAYNFEAPATVLSTTVAGSSGGTLEIYDYPGAFTQASDGETIATRQIEAYEAPGKSIRGSGYTRMFTAGYTFTLKGHGKAAVNASYVLRSVSLAASQDGYTNSFRAFKKDATFRPDRVTPRPVVPGVQTAVVVGASGDEILTDKFGRVKVLFHWDRDGAKDEKASCFIRVAQVWAGKAYGTMFIPRVGQEVVVQFLDGNPDTPLIIGMLYNGTNTVPYTLPANSARSTILSHSTKEGEAGNEICFDDTKDSENFYVHAQKDLNHVVEEKAIAHIKKARQVFVTADDPATDDAITDLLEVKGKRKITVKGENLEEHVNEGEFKHSVKGKFTLKVDGDSLTIEAKGDLKIKGKTVSIESTGGDLKLKSSANLAAEASKEVSNKSGTAFTNKAGTALTNKAGTELTNQAGTNLTSKAGANLDVKAGAMLNVKGSATGTIDGGGMLTVKGGLVKIN